jgi:hypothetical protein
MKSVIMRRPGMRQITSHRESAERYTALRFLGVVFNGLGSLLLIAGSLLLALVLSALLSTWMGEPTRAEVSVLGHPVSLGPLIGRLGSALPTLWSFCLLISGLQFLAIGSLFRLVINVEENTRISAQCLERLRSREAPIDQEVGSLFRS